MKKRYFTVDFGRKVCYYYNNGVKNMDETTNVKVLDKALTVLDALRTAKEPLGVNELAKLCDLSAATAFRILKTLKSRGWVYQNESEKYSAGLKLSYPSEPDNFWMLLRENAYHTMMKLSSAEREAMNLVVRDLERCFILCQSRTEKIVDYVPPVGTALPFHASACGKILLSELVEPTLGELLDTIDFRRMTASTITDRGAFLEELSGVREKGYALDAHESQEEGFCIAVPVRDKTGGIIAALSFSGFIGRKSAPEIDRYVGLLKSASDEISKKVFGD